MKSLKEPVSFRLHPEIIEILDDTAARVGYDSIVSLLEDSVVNYCSYILNINKERTPPQ